MKLMGQREYARHRGCKQGSVTDAINSGRISDALVNKGGRKKIDVEKADKLWAENTLPNNKNTDSTSPQSAGSGLIKARAAKETFAAKLAQIKYEQQSGKLCRIEDVRSAAANTSRITRDLLLSVPSRVAPILASETDINKINKILSKEIKQALESLSHINWDKIKENGQT